MALRATMRANEAQVDELIGWLRTTTPDRVMDEAAAKLAEGVAEDDLWAAGVLTACRYVNNQAHNLMGFVSHAMIGCEDARQLAQGQPDRTRYLLLMQALHQVVADLHDPYFGPYHLLPAWPVREAMLEESIRRLRQDIRMGEYMAVDHRMVGLNEVMSREEIADLILDIGLEGMVTDDHALISPVLSLCMIDLVGWEHGFDLLRWAARYSSSFPINFGPYDRCVALRAEFDLLDGPRVCDYQPERVQAVRARFMAAQPAERPVLTARLLAEEACSPATVIAAAAQVACDMYLMVDPVPHRDDDSISREVAPIHLGNCLRLLGEALHYMRPATQVLAALQAGSMLERGPAVISKEFRFVPFEPGRAYPYAEDVAGLSAHAPEQLLACLAEAMPAHDYRRATAAVQAYADKGGCPEAMIRLLTATACTDNGTLLHNVKHLNAMVNEFRRCELPDRWDYLTQATRFLTWYCGLTTTAYGRADAALKERLYL